MRNGSATSWNPVPNARWRPWVRGVLLVALLLALALPTGAFASTHQTLTVRSAPSMVPSASHVSPAVAPVLASAVSDLRAAAAPSIAALLPFLPGHGPLTRAQVQAALPLLQVDPLRSSLGAMTLAGHPLVRMGPLAGGNGNTQIPGSDCSFGSSLTSVGGSNKTLVAGVGTFYLIYNGSSGSFCSTQSLSPLFIHDGSAEIFRSTDGGATWSSAWMPANKSWTQSTSKTWLDFPFPDPVGIPIGDPATAADNNGNVLVSSLYVSLCFEFNNCTTAQFASGMTWGVAVTHSGNGGASWTGTAEVSHQVPIQSLTFNSTCQSQGFANGLYWQLRPEWPTVAINPVNKVAVAAWDVFNVSTATTNCLVSGFQVQASLSTDGGVTWGKPFNLSQPADWIPQVAFGPAPADQISVLFSNLANFTNTPPTISLSETVSTNNGTTWSTPVDIAPLGQHLLQSGMTPDAFAASNQTSIAFDNWTTSPHVGSQYVAWDDNGAGAQAGFPTIMVAYRPAGGGASWSTPVQVAPGGTSWTYYEPHVAVSSDGTVWVTYYGISQSNGNYYVYVAFSTNGGATWAPQQVVSTQVSQPSTSLRSIGSVQGLVGTTAGAVGLWTDCRTSACISSFDQTQFTATLAAVNVSSNAPIQLQITSGSVVTSVTLPQFVAWPVGSTHTLTAPAWVADAASGGNLVFLFSNYSGAITSTTRVTTFTFSTTGPILVNYQAVPASWISGYFTPNVVGAKLTIDSTPVTLTPVNSTTLMYNYSVASGVGAYYINASAPQYTPPATFTLGVTPHKTSWYNVTLQKAPGWFAGTILPINASLMLGATTVAVHPDGSFNQSAPWGAYTYTASSPGRVPVTETITISAGATLSRSLLLYGGWIVGKVSPILPGLTVKVNGIAWTTTNGNFNYTCNIAVIGCTAGFYNVSATEPGYNTTTFPTLPIAAGAVTFVNFTLTNKGSLEVKVLPAPAASIASVKATQGANVQYLVLNTATGYFVANGLATGQWTVTASANGYKSNSTIVTVTAGPFVGAPTTITLTTSTTGGCAPNCPTNNSSNPTKAASGLSTTDLLLIVAVIVLVGVVAAVLVLRRKPPTPSYEEAAPPSEPVYGMSPPPPPPPQ